MLKVFRRAGLLAASLALAAGCASDHPVAPSSSQSPDLGPSSSLLPAALGLTNTVLPAPTVTAGLQRRTPLTTALSVTQVVGEGGGVLSIPAAGVTVIVPTGALLAPVTITMTARAGTLVAYDFAPHGTTFAKPLIFAQALTGTNANPLTASLMQLGYYADVSLLTSTTAVMSELRGAVINPGTWTLISTIPHFSGYAVSCGRE